MAASEHVTIYTPESVLRKPNKLLADMLRDLLAARELAWRLAVRDISAQYRQTALGILWAFILPLANTLTWLFLSSSGVVEVGQTTLPYPIYVFTGSLLWSIFMDAVNGPLQQTAAARGMLAKLNFPREALIVSGIYQTLFSSAIKVVLMLGALVVVGIYPTWSLLLFPVGILSLIVAGTAFGLVITPLGLLYTDVGKALPLLMQFLMYITPVVFAMPSTGLAYTLFRLNPMTPLIMTTRDWLTAGPPAFLVEFWWTNGLLLLLLFIMWLIVRISMPILIERMSS